MPADLDAESAVLGSILLSRDACDEAAVMLTPDDFYDDAHAITFRAAMRLVDEGRPVDLGLLVDRLKSSRKTEAETEYAYIGGAAFLNRLRQAVATPAHVIYYADIVRKKSALRQLVAAGVEALTLAYDPDADPDEAVGSVESRLTEIAASRIDKRGEVVDLSRAFEAALARVDARQTNQHGEGIPLGYARLDEMTGGLREKELTIIGARPSQGKSALAVNICENIALSDNKTVLLVSLEMTSGEIAERILSSQARVKLWQMRNGTLSRDKMGDLVEAAGKFSQCNLYIDDAPSRSVSEIAALSRRMKRGKAGLDLLVVDYLQLIRPDNPRDPRQEQVAKISRRLKVLARELAIPVVALAQLNRQSDQGNRAPRLSDLRESGSLEQDADMVWFIHWPERTQGKEPIEDEQAEIHVAKQRQGPTGVVKLHWLRDYVRFDDRPVEPWDETRHHWRPEQVQDQMDF